MCCRAKNATFADLAIEGCTFDGTAEAQSVIEVSRCDDRESPGLVTLRRLVFRNNRLVGASGLRISASSCSDLEMIDVEIGDNVCLNDGCGVFLTKKSILENCAVSGNRLARFDQQPSSLLYASASSTTAIQGFAASENDLAVVRVQDSVLSLSNASFDGNSLNKINAEERKDSCIHSVKSSVTIARCSFLANEGYSGSAVFAKRSNVSVSSSVFRNNVGSFEGGCIYAARSNVTLENSSATYNDANSGGFMYAEKSNVTLESMSAVSNFAGNDGGFMSTRRSNVSFANTSAIDNEANWYGGFVSARDSTVTLENTTEATNSASSPWSYGGFMSVVNSNVSMANTSAIGNSAWVWGGFMFAEYSDVKLEDLTASNTSSTRGGSVYVKSSKLRILKARFSWSESEVLGGFAVLKNSSIWINDSELVQGSSKKGGAIWMKKSSLTAHNLSVSHCQARNAGGGVMCLASSSFLCSDCTFENNSAGKGEGGAIFFDSQHEQILALQLVRSRIENNVAELGGKTCKLDGTLSTFCFRRTLLRLRREERKMRGKGQKVSLYDFGGHKVLWQRSGSCRRCCLRGLLRSYPSRLLQRVSGYRS